MSLEDKLIAWANSTGKAKCQQAVMKELDINSMAASLVSHIQAVIPPALADGFGAEASVYTGKDGTVTIALEFQNKMRNGFTYPVYDIYGLFTQGWSYTKKPPCGMWHGNYVRARPTYVGGAFVQAGVDAWAAQLGDNVELINTEINSLYT